MIKKLFIYSLILVNTFSIDAKSIKAYKQTRSNKPEIPIIFHDNYDISCLGLEKLHPFDTKKYGKIADHLAKSCNLHKSLFFKPEKISDKDLLLVHTQTYLDSLKSSSSIAQVAEVYPLRYIPNFLLQRVLLNPMRYATAGTVLGAELALEYKWAINLSGGYHHAKSNSGGGFCYFADIPLAIKKLRIKHPNLKVLVLDLDAHQGNGHESILESDPLTQIFDIYNECNYPYDNQAKKAIDFDYPVSSGIEDKEYLNLLKKTLPSALEQAKPDLIIYNAGSDVYSKDPLGKMKISKNGIIERDKFVFEESMKRQIPILMVLSGGYSNESAEIVGESIENVLKNVIKIPNVIPRAYPMACRK